MAKDRRTESDGERVIDYRAEDAVHVPKRCPVCGAKITTSDRRGNVHIGLGDLQWASAYGITTEGPATTIYTSWECPVDPEHESGPVLLA